MIKGLYAAASAMLAGLTRQNALAHNVANVDTPGFRQILVSMEDFLRTTVVSGQTSGRLDLLGDLGLGVETGPEVTDFSGGALQTTGQPLDLAIQGDGFFRIETEDGERYTRDGRFSLDADGQLVTVDGRRVLSRSGAPIRLAQGTITVASDGTISVDGASAAQLGIASFEDPAAVLTRDGANSFAASGTPDGEDVGTVVQGFLEGANVNPAQVMTQMVAVSRAYEAAAQLVQVQDDLLGRAIESLGRL